MDTDLLKAFLGSAVRHGLTVAAPALIAAGIMPATETNAFISAGMFIAGLGWSCYQKYGMAIVTGLLKKITSRGTVAEAVATAKVNPAVLAATAAQKLGILFLAILLGVLMFSRPGYAQPAPKKGLAVTGNPLADINTDLHGGTAAKPAVLGVTLTGDITKDGPKIWQAILAANATDLAYASASAGAANTNGGTIRKQCVDAIIAVNAQASGSSVLNKDGTPMQKPDLSPISNIESVAELVDNLSPQGKLYTSCAGAATLFKTTVLQLISSLVTGVAAFGATGGIIP